MRSAALVVAVTVCFAGCSDAPPEPPPAAPEPAPVTVESLAEYNWVLITVDALRPDHLGFNGYADAETPAIDSLAEDGLVFSNAYANSSFLGQSMSALMTGRLPTRGGTVGILGAYPHDESETLAEGFEGAGYATALISNQSLLQPRGFTQGFEDVYVADGTDALSAEDVTSEALFFTEDIEGGQFFLHVHYAEPHEPYGAPGNDAVTVRSVRDNYAEYAADEGKRDAALAELRRRYDEEIASVDRAVQALIDGLADLGVAERTAIVLTASHGEEFWEHDYVGHAWTLYDEVLRVPFIVHAPGRVPAAVIEAPVSLVDLYPSLQVLLEIGTGRFDELDGAPLIVTEDGRASIRPRSTPILAELVLRDRFILRAQISAAQKTIAATRWPPPGERSREAAPPLTLWPEVDEWFVYDLNSDAGERTNVAGDRPASVAAFRKTLEGYRAGCAENGIAPRDLVDAMEIGDTENRESLETLGYL